MATDMSETKRLHHTVSTFTHKLEALQETLPALMGMAYVTTRMARAKKNKFLEENGELIEGGEEKDKYRVKLEHQKLVERLDKKARRASTALNVLPSKFLVAFVSEYDAFLGNLIKDIYRLRPELLDSSERSLSFSELKSIGSVEAAYEHVLEKEVESLLRKSHSEQFDWLENKFDLPLRKGLDSWLAFIELTERRNLLVHCDGVVSSQYLAVCGKNGAIPIGDLKIGDQLDTSREYLSDAYRCLYEFGVKLTHVLWRKLLPNDLDAADSSLISITYGLIHEEDYELAGRLLDFSTKVLKKWASDSNRRVFVINRAQCYYHSGDAEQCEKILVEEDWTACSDNYRICVEALNNNYADAARIMKRIGSNGSMSEADYIDWPVFRDFRASDEFRAAFTEVFGKEPVNIASLVKQPDIKEVFAGEVDLLEDELQEVSNKSSH